MVGAKHVNTFSLIDWLEYNLKTVTNSSMWHNITLEILIFNVITLTYDYNSPFTCNEKSNKQLLKFYEPVKTENI